MSKAKEFFDNFQPPKGFIVPDDFPLMRKKSVLVKKEDRSQSALKSGIIIPENHQTNKFVGRIYAVGPEAAVDLKPGMRVVFNAYANQTMMVDSIEYLFMSEIDIFAILTEDVQMFEESRPVEGRKQYSVDEMPDSDPETKEDKQEKKELADEFAEKLKKDASTRHYPTN